MPGAEPTTTLGQPTGTAIGFFLLFVALTLVITWWAAKRTRSAKEFYAAGGAFANPERSSLMTPLSLDAAQAQGLVDFMVRALTDCRVEREQAPFDHPSLPFPDGEVLPAVGAAGRGAC